MVAIPCPITYLPVCGLTTSPMGMNATCVLRACEYCMGRKSAYGSVLHCNLLLFPQACLTLQKLYSAHPEKLGERENLLPHSQIRVEPPALPAWTGPSMAEPLIPVCQLRESNKTMSFQTAVPRAQGFCRGKSGVTKEVKGIIWGGLQSQPALDYFKE